MKLLILTANESGKTILINPQAVDVINVMPTNDIEIGLRSGATVYVSEGFDEIYNLMREAQ